MNKKFEYIESAGPCSGSAYEHMRWSKKWDREKLEKFEIQTGIKIEYEQQLITHDKPDSHTLIRTFHTAIESDMMAFKLWWI